MTKSWWPCDWTQSPAPLCFLEVIPQSPQHFNHVLGLLGIRSHPEATYRPTWVTSLACQRHSCHSKGFYSSVPGTSKKRLETFFVYILYWYTTMLDILNEVSHMKQSKLQKENRRHTEIKDFSGGSDSKESESGLVVSNLLQSHGLYSPWISPGQNTGVGSLTLLQKMFPTHDLNWGLLYCRQILTNRAIKKALRHKESTCNAGATGERGSVPGLGRSPGEGNG